MQLQGEGEAREGEEKEEEGTKSADYIGMATHMTSQSQIRLAALYLCQTPMLPRWRKQHSLR